MNGTTDAVDLLDTALDTLQQEVLPAVDGKARTAGLMVANAVGIAIRVLPQGDALGEHETGGLRKPLARDGGHSINSI